MAQEYATVSDSGVVIHREMQDQVPSFKSRSRRFKRLFRRAAVFLCIAGVAATLSIVRATVL